MYKVIEKNIYSQEGCNTIALNYTFTFNGVSKSIKRTFDESELERVRIIKYKVSRLEKKHLTTGKVEDFDDFIHNVYMLIYEDVSKIDKLENEEWRDLDDIMPGYMVSNLGRLCHLKLHDNFIEYCLIKGAVWSSTKCKGKTSYLTDKLTYGNKTKDIKRHRLVAYAFIPNPNNLPEINHIDGNGLNNRVDNLEWVSSHENALHARRVLKRALNSGNTGEKCAASKLTWNIVNSIREEYKNNPDILYEEIAKKYDITRSCVSSIIRNRSWKDDNYIPPIRSNYHNKVGLIKVHKPKPYLINNQSKLTFEQAEEIRKKYYEDRLSQVVLAKEYGVSRSLISDVVNNKRIYNKKETNSARDRVIVYKGVEYTSIISLCKAINRSYTLVYNIISKFDINKDNKIILDDTCFDIRVNNEPMFKVGDIVKDIEIIGYDKDKKDYMKYLCKCLVCGKIYYASAKQIREYPCKHI